jgi:hypothetical protein
MSLASVVEADQLQDEPLTLNAVGAVSFDVQVPWKPSDVLPPGLITGL